MSLADKKLQKVARVVAAARSLFAEKGFEGTAMEDIARASNYAVGSLYYHFASKEELCAHIVIGEMQVLMERLEATRRQESDFVAKSMEFAHHYLDFYLNNYTYYELIWYREDKIKPVLLKRITYLHKKALALYQQLIISEKQRGAIKAEIDPVKTTAVLWALLNGVAASARYQLEAITGMSVDDLLQTNMDMVLHGIVQD